ncbi:uncharacterized protein [Amphiura filiformis]|uniref:uncharacterized protein n=1 Tax=Amphiura filiformis TaxID=82378 RepID=UPI003B2149D1
MVELAGPNEAGFYEQIVTHNHAASASGEPTAVVVSPPEENATSADTTTTTTYYTLVLEGSSYDGNSVVLTSETPESISVPILTSSVLEIDDADSHQILFMPTEDVSDERSIWIQSPLAATSGGSDDNLTDLVDITRKACIASNIGPEDMGTDVVTIVSPETHGNMVKFKMCIDKHNYRDDDDDDEIHIEVVDDIISSGRPDSTMTIDSETTSESMSSDGFDRKTDSLNSSDSENDKEVRLEIRNDSKHSKRTPNPMPICGVADDCPLIRIPPPVTRTPLPNLPGIKGTSLAATEPAVISKAIDSTPLNANKERNKKENIQSGPILHSVSSILLKENDSCNSETSPIRPVPQIRPCFGPFAGLNHQLLSRFSFAHTSPSLTLPPLTVFASPLGVLHPGFTSPQSKITSIPPFPNASFPSTVGLRGTLPGNLPGLRVIPPPFATSAETRRIVRRRRHSGNSKLSEHADEDPESQKVRRRQANARERDRVTQLNSGFEQLRRVLPWVQQSRRTSKVDTLRAAIAYIDHLSRVLWEADHAGYLGGPVTVGPGLTTDICKFVEFRPTFGMLPPPSLPAMCIGAAERSEIERSRIGSVPGSSLMKASTQAMIAGTGHPNPTLHWLAEFQETLRRLPKPIEPSPRRFLTEMENRPRIVVVDSDSNNNVV